MSIITVDSFRKYSINVSLNDNIDQLNGQLRRLLENTNMHFIKKRKLLLQLERKNNQYRRSIDRADLENNRKLAMNDDLIRCIKKKIIGEDRQQRQQMENEQEQYSTWSMRNMGALVGVVVAIIISVATLIITMLQNTKQRNF